MEEHREKWEHYAAGIMAEARRGWVAKPGQVKANDFLVTFRHTNGNNSDNAPSPALPKTPQQQIDAMSDEEYDRYVKECTEISKGAWLSWVDVGQQPAPTKIT